MVQSRVVLLSLLVVLGTPGTAVAAPSPDDLPAGPWPPSKVLAQDPARVPVPLAAAAVTDCPVPTPGVKRSAPGAGKTVALTFDDGPGASTGPILSILQQTGVAATFFNLGVNMASRPTWVRAEATIGNALANHSWSHPRMPTLSAAAQGTEMDRATAQQSALTGIQACYFRPPYGEYNTATLNAAQQRRMGVWNWSVDTEDWKANGSSSAYWVNRIATLAEAGGSQQHPVILMHNAPAGNPATVAALPRIINFYRARGYTFVDLAGRTGSGIPAPAAATTASGVHVFSRATNGSLSERTRTGTAWGAPVSLGGAMFGGAGAAATGPGVTTVFVQGTDNHVYHRTVPDSGTPSGWVDLGGFAISRPSAAYSADGTLSVVIRGADSAGWIRQRVNGTWGAWQRLGHAITSAPTIAATAGGGLTVGAIGTDRALWVTHKATTTWTAWRKVGGAITADPALSATSDGARLVVAVRGTDDAVHVSVGDAAATTWTGWQTIGGLLSSGNALTVSGTTLATYAYGRDGRLWENVATGGTTGTGWRGWSQLPN